MVKHTKTYNWLEKHKYIYLDIKSLFIFIKKNYLRLSKKYPIKMQIVTANIYFWLVELGFKNTVDFIKDILV